MAAQSVGKKESSSNAGTFKQGATMAETNAARTGGSLGITSPLKDASTKGIISGKGMLSF